MQDQLHSLLNNRKPKPLGLERTYAILLPLVFWDDQWHILYQLRSEAISQPGEVSFPGGRVEAGETYQEAAIRETMEELNLSSDQIDILGELDYLVFGKSMIRCFVGILQTDWTSIKPNEEVAKLFTIPLSTMQQLEPTYYQLDSIIDPQSNFPFERIRGGKEYPFSHHQRLVPFYEGLEENLWGMTAQFTQGFVEMIKDSQ
ncbi:TPA: CoA pyrophosphatase [Streptococcus suis]